MIVGRSTADARRSLMRWRVKWGEQILHHWLIIDIISIIVGVICIIIVISNGILLRVLLLMLSLAVQS